MINILKFLFLHFLAVQGESGYIIFIFFYGILTGGFHYVFKMYIFDISQSRNFIRTWPIIQAMQGFGVIIGLPMRNDIFNGTCLILAALVLVLGDRYSFKILMSKITFMKMFNSF